MIFGDYKLNAIKDVEFNKNYGMEDIYENLMWITKEDRKINKKIASIFINESEADDELVLESSLNEFLSYSYYKSKDILIRARNTINDGTKFGLSKIKNTFDRLILFDNYEDLIEDIKNFKKYAVDYNYKVINISDYTNYINKLCTDIIDNINEITESRYKYDTIDNLKVLLDFEPIEKINNFITYRVNINKDYLISVLNNIYNNNEVDYGNLIFNNGKILVDTLDNIIGSIDNIFKSLYMMDKSNFDNRRIIESFMNVCIKISSIFIYMMIHIMSNIDNMYLSIIRSIKLFNED